MLNYDVIIPVAGKDTLFIPRVVDYVSRCLVGAKHIYILTADSNICRIEKLLCKLSTNCLPCTVIDENKLIPDLNFVKIKELLERYAPQYVKITGWYFQQFLKLAFSRSQFANDYYVSWDADTLPLAPISFFDSEHLLFNPKDEYNPNYFNTINRIFGYGKVYEKSFISETMIFSTNIVKEMLCDIERVSIDGKIWFEKIMASGDFSSDFPVFSEFETYGSYCFVNYQDLYKPRHLNSFREAGLINSRYISDDMLRAMSFDLDMASFEIRDWPAFPLGIICRIRMICSMDFKEFLSKIMNRIKIKKIKKINNTYRLPQ